MAKGIVTYDKTKLNEALKIFHTYQVGDIYFYLHDNQIKEAQINEVNLNYYDYGLTHTAPRALSVKVEITALVYGSKRTVTPGQLYLTKEEAAEAFLDANGIDKEVVQVAKSPKFGTTVEDLIDRLRRIDPTIDLEPQFQFIVDIIQDILDNPKEAK